MEKQPVLHPYQFSGDRRQRVTWTTKMKNFIWTIYLCSLYILCREVMSHLPSLPDTNNRDLNSSAICNNYRVLDNAWRSVENGEGNNCDSNLQEGWYKVTTTSGQKATIPTSCIKTDECGVEVPLYLNLRNNDLPRPGHTSEVDICGSDLIRGRWHCCVLREPTFIHNCGHFLIYWLKPPNTCSVGYCIQGPNSKIGRITAKTGELADVTNARVRRRLPSLRPTRRIRDAFSRDFTTAAQSESTTERTPHTTSLVHTFYFPVLRRTRLPHGTDAMHDTHIWQLNLAASESRINSRTTAVTHFAAGSDPLRMVSSPDASQVTVTGVPVLESEQITTSSQRTDSDSCCPEFSRISFRIVPSLSIFHGPSATSSSFYHTASTSPSSNNGLTHSMHSDPEDTPTFSSIDDFLSSIEGTEHASKRSKISTSASLIDSLHLTASLELTDSKVISYPIHQTEVKATRHSGTDVKPSHHLGHHQQTVSEFSGSLLFDSVQNTESKPFSLNTYVLSSSANDFSLYSSRDITDDPHSSRETLVYDQVAFTPARFSTSNAVYTQSLSSIYPFHVDAGSADIVTSRSFTIGSSSVLPFTTDLFDSRASMPPSSYESNDACVDCLLSSFTAHGLDASSTSYPLYTTPRQSTEILGTASVELSGNPIEVTAVMDTSSEVLISPTRVLHMSTNILKTDHEVSSARPNDVSVVSYQTCTQCIVLAFQRHTHLPNNQYIVTFSRAVQSAFAKLLTTFYRPRSRRELTHTSTNSQRNNSIFQAHDVYIRNFSILENITTIELEAKRFGGFFVSATDMISLLQREDVRQFLENELRAFRVTLVEMSIKDVSVTNTITTPSEPGQYDRLPLFIQHLGLYVTVIVLSSCMAFAVIVALIYLRNKARSGMWHCPSGTHYAKQLEQALLNKKMTWRVGDVENPLPDVDILRGERQMTETPTARNAARPDGEEGNRGEFWDIPFNDKMDYTNDVECNTRL